MDTIFYHGMEGGIINGALHNQWHTPEGGCMEKIMGGVILGCHTPPILK